MATTDCGPMKDLVKLNEEVQTLVGEADEVLCDLVVDRKEMPIRIRNAIQKEKNATLAKLLFGGVTVGKSEENLEELIRPEEIREQTEKARKIHEQLAYEIEKMNEIQQQREQEKELLEALYNTLMNPSYAPIHA